MAKRNKTVRQSAGRSGTEVPFRGRSEMRAQTETDGAERCAEQPGVKAVFVCNLKPEAKEVYLAGDFNLWNPKAHRMERSNGQFQKTMRLPPGEHQYKFVIDGEWRVDPAAAQVPNDCGTTNNVIRV